MSLSSLTVDLTLGLARFEADSGKAVQIITRDSESMARKAKTFEDALIRQANAASRLSPEFKIAEAAALGLGDSTIALIKSLSSTGGAFASVGARGTEAFGLVGGAAAQAGSAAEQRMALVVSKLREAKVQADALRESARAENAAGTLSDDGLKQKLAGIKRTEAAYLELAKVGIAQELAAERAAQIEIANNDKRKASIQTLIDKLAGVPIAYKQQIAALQESLKAGDITPKQFQAGVLQANAQRPDVQKFKAEQEAAIAAVVAAEKRQAVAEEQLAVQADADAKAKVIAAQKIIDVQNGLTSTYRSQLAVLRELRDAGALTQDQFKQAGADLVAKQPGVQARTSAQAEAEAAAKAAAASALAVAQAGSATATAAAHSQVYAAFLYAEAAASNQAAQAAAHQAEVTKAVADASARSIAAQQAAYATKTAFIAKVNEEADALFRTKDAQKQLDAERAGVSAQEAAQLAKFAGDREFLASIYQKIEAERQYQAELGKTETEILKMRAAERGLTNTAAGPIGRFDDLAKANQAAKDLAASTVTRDAFRESVNRSADAIGKLPSVLLAEQAAVHGLTAELAPAIAKIADFEAKTGQAGKAAFGTKNQLLTLHYTLSDVVASLASGISPFTILAQQGGQVYDAFGQSTTAIFQTIKGLITPLRVAIGGTAAAVGVLAYAFHEGAKESKAFADAMVLTGGFAGITEGQFNAMAKGIAASGQVSISAAREFGQALISTGEVGPRVLSAAAEAAARYGAATGKNAKEVAQDFASMSKDVTKWAAEHNRSLNFITAAQYDQIKSLQEQGRAAEAQGIVYDALNERLKKLEPNLGTLDKALRIVTTSWHSFWDSAFDVGRTETIEDKIAALKLKIKLGQPPPVTETPGGAAFVAPKSGRRATAQAADDAKNAAALLGAERKKLRQDDAAFQEADKKEAIQAAIAFDAVLDPLLIKAKAKSAYDLKLIELEAGFRAKAEAGRPVSPERQKIARDQLKKDFTDHPAVSEADAQRKALLDQDLKYLQANLAEEQDALKFNQDQLAAIYAAGNVSTAEFYDRREKIIADGIQKELNQLTDEQARIEVELEEGVFKSQDERTKLQTQLEQSQAKSANVTRDAEHKAALAVYERAAAVKALTQQVTEFRASLLQQQGDEFGAAQLRAVQAIAQAREFATKAERVRTGGDVIREEHRTESGTSLRQQIDEQERLTDAANKFAEVQRQVGFASQEAARNEELFLLTATKSGASLEEQEKGVFAIRSVALAQLGTLVDRAKALADAEALAAAQQNRLVNPAVLAYANDLALQYAKAADVVEPALNRMRAATDALAQSMANSLTSSSLNFGDLFKTRLTNASQETSQQAKALDDQLAQLRHYLANSSDAKEQALLRDQIKQNQAKRNSLEVSKSEQAVKTVERDILGPILKQIRDAAVKQYITDPIQETLKGLMRQLAEGGLKNFLQGGQGLTIDKAGQGIDAIGHGFSPAKDKGTADAAAEAAKALEASTAETAATTSATAATAAQTAAVQTSTTQIALMAEAAQLAAAALSQASISAGGSGLGSFAAFDTSGYGIDAAGHGFTPSMNYGGGGATGTNFVERDMLTIIHKGEAIVPKAYNPATLEGMSYMRGIATKNTQANGGGKTGGNVYITNNSPAEVRSAQRDNNGDWHVLINAAAEQAHSRVAADVASGSGRVSTSMKSRGLSLDGGNPRRR